MPPAWLREISYKLPALPAFDKLAQSMAAATAVFDSPALHSILEAQNKQLAAMSEAIRQLAVPQVAGLENIRKAIANFGAASAALEIGSPARGLSEMINAVGAASLAQQANQIETPDMEEDES